MTDYTTRLTWSRNSTGLDESMRIIDVHTIIEMSLYILAHSNGLVLCVVTQWVNFTKYSPSEEVRGVSRVSFSARSCSRSSRLAFSETWLYTFKSDISRFFVTRTQAQQTSRRFAVNTWSICACAIRQRSWTMAVALNFSTSLPVRLLRI